MSGDEQRGTEPPREDLPSGATEVKRTGSSAVSPDRNDVRFTPGSMLAERYRIVALLVGRHLLIGALRALTARPRDLQPSPPLPILAGAVRENVRMLRSLLAATLILSAAASAADEVSLPRTTVQRITSKANGIGYRLYVSVPPDYATSRERYPVIYLLDADYSFAIAHNVVEHLADRRDLPWAIVVGIAYDGPPQYRMHRTRDYTPTHTLDLRGVPVHQQPYQKYTGGGPKFRDFLRSELLPLIDRTYRTTRDRVLVGHSYGGLFAAWMLLTAPETFSGYVAVSPSLWYDRRLAFRLDAANAMRGRIYLAAGAMENPIMGSDVRELAARLRKTDAVAVRSEVMEGETHNSIFPGALSRGLRWVLKGR